MTSPAAPPACVYWIPDLPESLGDRPVYGGHVVVDELVDAIIRTSTRGISLVGRPRSEQLIEQQIRRIAAGDASVLERVAAVPMRALVRGDAHIGVFVEPYSVFQRGLYLRSHGHGAPFPVVTITHTLSFATMLHDWFLALLLADVKPYDSVVCTTESSRLVVTRALDHVAQAMNERHGTDLAFRGRLDVVPLGVDTNVFRPRPKGPIRDSIEVGRDDIVVLYLGRISAEDKADLLPVLLVLRRLCQRWTAESREGSVVLVIAGTGREDEERVLRRAIATLGLDDNVRLLSPLARRFPRHMLYAAADVFLSTPDNVQESFGITPIEALAAGLPQVVSDWDGYRESVVDGITGFRVPTAGCAVDPDIDVLAAIQRLPFWDHGMLATSVEVDVRSLEASLWRLVSDSALREQMAAASRARAVAEYDLAGIVRRHELLWAELAVQATGEVDPPRPSSNYAVPRFADTFGHYPTIIVGDETVLQAARSDADVAWQLFLERARFGWSDVAIARQVLDAFETAPTAVGDVDIDGADSKEVQRHVMTMLKFGLLERLPQPVRPASA